MVNIRLAQLFFEWRPRLMSRINKFPTADPRGRHRHPQESNFLRFHAYFEEILDWRPSFDSLRSALPPLRNPGSTTGSTKHLQ